MENSEQTIIYFIEENKNGEWYRVGYDHIKEEAIQGKNEAAKTNSDRTYRVVKCTKTIIENSIVVD